MDLRLLRESQLPFDVVLSSGETLTVDWLKPTDEAGLRELFQRLSPDSRYQRFHVHVTDLTDAQWRYLTHVDGIDHVALVAAFGREIVGVARLIALPGDAEIAFLVEDSQQRRGIGSVLRDALLAIARARGLHRLHAHVLPENLAIRRLLATPGVELVGDRGNVLELVLTEAAS